MKSAIGEGMTRKDHADVSNQLVCVHSVYIHISFLGIQSAGHCRCRTCNSVRECEPLTPPLQNSYTLLRPCPGKIVSCGAMKLND